MADPRSEKRYFVYVLRSLKDGTLYKGLSADPVKRLRQHNYGQSTFTKRRRPYQLVYSEECANRASALKREKYLKSSAGSRFLAKLMSH